MTHLVWIELEAVHLQRVRSFHTYRQSPPIKQRLQLLVGELKSLVVRHFPDLHILLGQFRA